MRGVGKRQPLFLGAGRKRRGGIPPYSARQGIVICVPEGNARLNSEGFPEDATRLPSFYDGTYEYLKSIGIKEL